MSALDLLQRLRQHELCTVKFIQLRADEFLVLETDDGSLLLARFSKLQCLPRLLLDLSLQLLAIWLKLVQAALDLRDRQVSLIDAVSISLSVRDYAGRIPWLVRLSLDTGVIIRRTHAITHLK